MRAPREAPAALLVGAMAGALIAGRLETAGLCVAAAALGAALAGAPRPGRPWWIAIATGSLIAVSLNLYLNAGEPLTALPALFGRPATDGGLRYGVLLALRLAGAAIAVHGLRAAWPGERAADAGARWLGPLRRLRVPVDEARVVLGLAIRFAPLLAEEARRVAAIQRLRAGRAPRTLGERLRAVRAAAVPTLVRALERAEQLAIALEARHYRLRPAAASPGGPLAPAFAGAGTGLAGIALLWR